MTLEERVKIFDGNGSPRNVMELDFGFGGRFAFCVGGFRFCFCGCAHGLRVPRTPKGMRRRSFAPPGLDFFPFITHGLRRGLYSCAASRLTLWPLRRSAANSWSFL